MEKREKETEFYSEPFYTSPGGYKMCVSVYPNGHNAAQGSHVSVYLKLLEGPNDESLHWPFMGTVEFKLLNQLTDNGHHVRTFTLDTDHNSRPGSYRGHTTFLPHSKLSHDSARNTQYLMEDILYFRATVTTKVIEHRPWLITTSGGTNQ